MYFRNDRKMIELKKAFKDKERLLEKFNIIEEQYHNLKMLNFDKSEEIRDLTVKLERLTQDFDYLKNNFDNEKQLAVQKAEKPLKGKIASLEYDLRVQKDKLKTLKQQYEFSQQSDDVLGVMDKLSVMFLTKNSDPTCFTPTQQKLIKSLFGDFATRKYKEEIDRLSKE